MRFSRTRASTIIRDLKIHRVDVQRYISTTQNENSKHVSLCLNPTPKPQYRRGEFNSKTFYILNAVKITQPTISAVRLRRIPITHLRPNSFLVQHSFILILEFLCVTPFHIFSSNPTAKTLTNFIEMYYNIAGSWNQWGSWRYATTFPPKLHGTSPSEYHPRSRLVLHFSFYLKGSPYNITSCDNSNQPTISIHNRKSSVFCLE